MINFPVKFDPMFMKDYKELLVNLAQETITEVQEGFTLKEYMNKKEAAEYIGISFNTLRKLEREGLQVINAGGVLLIKRTDIDDFLEERKK